MKKHRHFLLTLLAAGSLFLLATSGGAEGVEDLLPDVTVVPELLGEITFTSLAPGRRQLHFTTATSNIGTGRLEIRGSSVTPAGQEVLQRVYRSDGTFYDRFAGTFTYHPEHAHVHFTDWGIYRLRSLLPDGGVGPVVAMSNKTSFCLLDLIPLEAGRTDSNYTTCNATIQGISPRWADMYDFSLADQNIDISGVPDGHYWLEAEVDPDNRVIESNEHNNIARIQILIAPPPQAVADRFEDNDSPALVSSRPLGAADSPNLGPLPARLELAGLSMEDDWDYYAFRIERTPGAGGYLRIDSQYLESDLDLWLLDAGGNGFNSSETFGNLEQVPLAGLPPGDYFALVIGYSGENPDYRLTFDLEGNRPPTIQMLEPSSAELWVERAFETFEVRWAASDAEADPTRVALFIDRDRARDKSTRALHGYQKLSGEAGQARINTAGLELGTWFLYAEASDGAGRSGQWAAGAVVLYTKGDLNFDGHVDHADWRAFKNRKPGGGHVHRKRSRQRLPAGWEYVLDMDRDGDVDRRDERLFLKAVRHEHEH